MCTAVVFIVSTILTMSLIPAATDSIPLFLIMVTTPVTAFRVVASILTCGNI